MDAGAAWTMMSPRSVDRPVVVPALILALSLSGSAAPQQTRGLAAVRTDDGRTVELYGQSHALVIGMSKYASGWRVLPGVETDVVAVRDVLQAHGFLVQVERDLTREAFDRVMRTFIAERGRSARNRLVIYFAGHGHTETASDGRQFGFIVPVDAPLPTADPIGFRSRAISMDQVEVYAREIESRHALMVFDSCFSGTLFTISRALPGAIASNLEQPVRQFITSGTEGQEVPDTSEFRRQFVAGLKGEADLFKDGYITGSELGMFLEQSVAEYTRQAQTPKFGKIRDGLLDKGDLIFVSPATPPELRAFRRESGAAAAAVSRPDDRTHWEAIKDSRDRNAFEEFVKQFPQSQYKTLAERRLDELVREDPVATADRFFAALRARDTRTAHAHMADLARQMLPESQIMAQFDDALRTPVADGRRVIYEERAEGKMAMVLFAAGDQLMRASLLRDGSRWGVFSYRWLPLSLSRPAAGPPLREAATEYLDLVFAKRYADAYLRWSAAVRTQMSSAQFAEGTAGAYNALGSPQSRELVYVEQHDATTGFVLFRFRFANTSLYQRVSLVLEAGRWMVVGWLLSPAPSS